MICCLSIPSWAQQPKAVVYQIKVFTKAGNHLRGILEEVTDSYLYLRNEKRGQSGRIPFANIQKVVIRRKSKKNALISGAIVGGLLTGYVANQSLQNNPVRGPVIYGLTLTLSAAGGAAAGLLVGSAIGNSTRRVIRPLDQNNPDLSLFRQLQPLSWRYQQDFINRLPKN